MKKSLSKEIAITGHVVELNHSEMVVVAQFIQDVENYLAVKNNKDKSSYELLKTANCHLTKSVAFIKNLFGDEDVMSLAAAQEGLFTSPPEVKTNDQVESIAVL